MAAYQPEQWSNFFVAIAGAAATLAGLLFVAVSLNHQQILSSPRLPPLAARSVAVLVVVVVECALGLAPGQDRVILGAETLALGVVTVVGVVLATLRARTREVPLRYHLGRTALALASSAPMVMAGLSMIIGVGGGLYWILAEIVSALFVSMYGAWVLLLGIRRRQPSPT